MSRLDPPRRTLAAVLPSVGSRRRALDSKPVMNDGIAAALHGTRVGSVEAIHVATGTGGDPAPRDCVTAVADRGIEGDRYFAGDGIYNDREDLDPSDVTLIEAEALAAAAADYDVDLRGGAHRRNITTRGVALNHLVGHRFRVGGATLEGTGLCEPCGYMESLADQPDAERALVHRGGLDARIVDSGAIETGDDVVW